MNADVRFGELQGVDLVLDQWERYSIFHEAIRWTMKSMEVTRGSSVNNCDDDGVLSVMVKADLCVRFSRRTIEKVFPHLLGDEVLTQLLIGLEVTYPCINHFCFSKNGKIEWYAVDVDFVGALFDVLKTPELVARVMSNAQIVKSHMICAERNDQELAAKDVSIESYKSSSIRSVQNTVEDNDNLFGEPTSTPASSRGVQDRLDLAYILTQ
ncbi:hypothetical protein PsorP6_003319 [Peronosclerospora sorghi]|uniref:Uncharacterized protein n=1 Tax=Peronosclerospora sorghi TaxID=230839 RepID=A0ACC0VMH4_9STRA|nr:hypothetical protein PsorP6_003319 [Peronosclerospora sorghi]